MAIEKRPYKLRIDTIPDVYGPDVPHISATSAPTDLGLNAAGTDIVSLTQGLPGLIDALILNRHNLVMKSVSVRIVGETDFTPFDVHFQRGLPDGFHDLEVEVITPD